MIDHSAHNGLTRGKSREYSIHKFCCISFINHVIQLECPKGWATLGTKEVLNSKLAYYNTFQKLGYTKEEYVQKTLGVA